MYDFDIQNRLIGIFRDHCNLSVEQYEEISGRLYDLEAEIQEIPNGVGTLGDAEDKAGDLSVIFEFLFNTKELTLYEYNELCNLTNEMWDAAQAVQKEATRP